MKFIAVAFFSYLVGSIPFSPILAKLRGVNLAEAGTKNLGATNLGITTGAGWGTAAVILDSAKGLIPVILAKIFFGTDEAALLAALFAILGHDFSVWLKFRGGKGLATSGGAVIAIEPMLFIIAFSIYAVIFLITRKYIFTTLIIFLCLPLISFGIDLNWKYWIFCAVIAAIAFYTHRADLKI